MSQPSPSPAPQDHLGAVAARELSPVNNTFVTVTTLCSGVVTIVNELIGDAFHEVALYVFSAVWVVAIIVVFALIGRLQPVTSGVNQTDGGLNRWLRCIRQGMRLCRHHWQYSLMLLAVLTMAGMSSYLNYKRALQTPSAPAIPLTAQDYQMYLFDGNVAAIEHARKSGITQLRYVDPMFGNALESLIIRHPDAAIKMMELVKPEPVALAGFDLSPMFKLQQIYPNAFNDSLMQSVGIRVVDSLPTGSVGGVYAERDSLVLSNIRVTPLMLAVWSGNRALMEALVKAGADPDEPTSFRVLLKTHDPKHAGSWTFRTGTVSLHAGHEAKRLGIDWPYGAIQPPRLSLR